MGAAACEHAHDLAGRRPAGPDGGQPQLGTVPAGPQRTPRARPITVNSDQCSGWTTQAVLQSRWGDEFDANWAAAGPAGRPGAVRPGFVRGPAGRRLLPCRQQRAHPRPSQRVWVEALPYLQGVDSAWDQYADGFEVSVQYTAQQVSDALASGLGIQAGQSGSGPAGWVGETVWDDAGYVESITLCGQQVSGTQVRSALSLRSACFAIAWQDGQFNRDHPRLRPRRGAEPGRGPRHGRPAAAAGRRSCCTTFPAPRSAAPAHERPAAQNRPRMPAACGGGFVPVPCGGRRGSAGGEQLFQHLQHAVLAVGGGAVFWQRPAPRGGRWPRRSFRPQRASISRSLPLSPKAMHSSGRTPYSSSSSRMPAALCRPVAIRSMQPLPPPVGVMPAGRRRRRPSNHRSVLRLRHPAGQSLRISSSMASRSSSTVELG